MMPFHIRINSKPSFHFMLRLTPVANIFKLKGKSLPFLNDTFRQNLLNKPPESKSNN